jgi:RNA polymerase sigma-70 factor (ECF subfamily)
MYAHGGQCTAEAEDLTQETFLQLHRKISTFRGDSAFSTWLHRLAINVVLMHLRKKGLSLISMDEAMEPDPQGSPGRGFGARDLSLAGSIDRMALERAVGNLPAGYRLVFVLHDIEGYEHHEIASMLDCSSATASPSCTRRGSSCARLCASLPRQEARP